MPEIDDITIKLAGAIAVMAGDMGVRTVLRNGQVLYQRQSSYLYLELFTAEE